MWDEAREEMCNQGFLQGPGLPAPPRLSPSTTTRAGLSVRGGSTLGLGEQGGGCFRAPPDREQCEVSRSFQEACFHHSLTY